MTDQAPGNVVSRLKRFAAQHDGATAVLQNMGEEGVRITLVGGDGIMGDQIVTNPAQAKDAAEKAGLDTSEWDRDLVSKATTEPGHHERMAGYRATSR
ncbi:hypothetical protein [Tsukamurella paurometabola]|uniref:Uncharacterized protein n=1 Tax=Tsukamurella paurometabola TaxID=2061 RepID=A0ABS5NGZ1_TSUPA|nr:hypothetical protein [Tsukamurella paurometabola]MBS4103561.1 hypothetical protein [Tsukamurella paurometabola]